MLFGIHHGQKMFSGIIQHKGSVVLNENDKLVINSKSSFDKLIVGESIAVNGVCLTLEDNNHLSAGDLLFSIGAETKILTTLGNLKPHEEVHLERALSLSGLVGGHLVQGHVDGIGVVQSMHTDGQSLIIRIKIAADLRKFLITKGSIGVNGISLTLNDLGVDYFEVCLIPHTLEKSLLGQLSVASLVNIECDMVGKYIYNFVSSAQNGISL